MNAMSGRELFHHLRSIETAEQYLVARTRRELAAHEAAKSSRLNLVAVAYTAYATLFAGIMIVLTGPAAIA